MEDFSLMLSMDFNLTDDQEYKFAWNAIMFLVILLSHLKILKGIFTIIIKGTYH